MNVWTEFCIALGTHSRSKTLSACCWLTIWTKESRISGEATCRLGYGSRAFASQRFLVQCWKVIHPSPEKVCGMIIQPGFFFMIANSCSWSTTGVPVALSMMQTTGINIPAFFSFWSCWFFSTDVEPEAPESVNVRLMKLLILSTASKLLPPLPDFGVTSLKLSVGVGVRELSRAFSVFCLEFSPTTRAGDEPLRVSSSRNFASHCILFFEGSSLKLDGLLAPEVCCWPWRLAGWAILGGNLLLSLKLLVAAEHMGGTCLGCGKFVVETTWLQLHNFSSLLQVTSLCAATKQGRKHLISPFLLLLLLLSLNHDLTSSESKPASLSLLSEDVYRNSRRNVTESDVDWGGTRI